MSEHSGSEAPKQFQVQVAPECPRFVNFLRVKAITGDKISFDVGGLGDVDAGRLWDDWKARWLEHVKKRRENLEGWSPSNE